MDDYQSHEWSRGEVSNHLDIPLYRILSILGPPKSSVRSLGHRVKAHRLGL